MSSVAALGLSLDFDAPVATSFVSRGACSIWFATEAARSARPPAPSSVTVAHGGVEVPVEPGDHVERDLLGAGGRALTDVRAAAEALGVVLGDHVDDAG